MPKATSRKGTFFRLAALALALVVSAGAGLEPAAADDRDLLRFNSGKPYLFIIFDTSSSMNTAPDGSWVPGSGDDPGSKLYQAKQVVYDVFKDVDNVHLGFATFNQDELRVRAKHWLYLPNNGGPSIGWPDVDDLWTFGKHFVDDAGTPLAGGTCGDPLNLGNAFERAAANRFAKLGVGGMGPTTLFVRDGGATYRVTVTAPPFQPDTTTNRLGRDTLHVDLELQRVTGSSCAASGSPESTNMVFKLVREFVMADSDAGFSAGPPGGGGNATEEIAGFWNWQDAQATADCSDGHPFTGKGWEGNYDGLFTANGSFVNTVDNTDPFVHCSNPLDLSGCLSLKRPTAPSAFGRATDVGDMLPLHWQIDNKESFLARLAPNHPDGGVPDFGIASYFQDSPVVLTSGPDNGLDFLPLKSFARRPLIAAGETPLGKAVIDFRCYYLGEGNKCRDSAYDPSWEEVALANDPEWGCRRPYLVVISDGIDTCGGENPCADTANLNSRSGVKTWVVAYGANCANAGNPLKCMAQNGKGELLCPSDPQSLKDELNKILGVIQEEARAFASAAVPSVQATADDKIHLSSFTPLNNRSVWDGHLNAFLKPLPLDTSGRPDTNHPNHLWDAGELLATTQAPAQATADAATTRTGLRLGTAATQRRVFYSRLVQTDGSPTVPGLWPKARSLFMKTGPAAATAAEVRHRYDFWRALGIPFVPDFVDGTGTRVIDPVAVSRADQTVADTLAIKEHTLTLPDSTTVDLEYVLGDIFHSDPAIYSAPDNTTYFAIDLGTEGDACEDDDPGYQCFFAKHARRRKIVFVGANDGQLHAFDAGIFREGIGPNGEDRFDNGSGHELFSYMPRAAMPTVRRQAEGTNHQFSVDGPVKLFDAFIDPVDPLDENGREWRTLVVGGLREGGSAYYALDVTQPDTLDSDYVPQPDNGYVPSCIGSLDNDPGPEVGCGPVPFPVALWEFNDSVLDAATQRYVRLDEDGNGVPDLGDTWSRPAVGRIRVCAGTECNPAVEPNDLEDRYVVVVGGGMDADDKLNPQKGDWLYMIDVETGEAIYKRRLLDPNDASKTGGSAPSEPAVADINRDGYLDRIYLGTIGGFMYRVDLEADAAGNFPVLNPIGATDVNGTVHTVERITVDSASNPIWEPRVVFNANFDGTSATNFPRPIYHRPAVLFVAKLGSFALAFGTGDREDLWSQSTQEGRFYVFVDDTASGDPPIRESNLVEIDEADGNLGLDLLFTRGSGQRGWFLVLAPNEKVITTAFSLSGITVFSSFQPDIQISAGRNPLCSKTGGSRIFVVNSTNGDSFLKAADDTDTRYLDVNTFVTQPFLEQGQTRAAAGTGSTADDLTPQLQEVMESLKGLYPSNTKFGNFFTGVKTVSSDTGVIFIAPVPIGIVEKNWTDN